TVYLDATALSTNESYTVGSNILQIARPSGTETITVSSMNSIALSAGSGNDSITMNQYSAGIPVTVNGGFGDDTLNIGGGNLSANITSIAAFTFNGQSGFDRFNLNNASEPGAWQYIRDIGTIRADRLTAPVGYFIILGETGIEEMTVNAGAAGDAFYTRAIEPGASVILNAGGGLDGLVVADSTQNLAGIQGLVRYYAGAGGGNVLVSDNADTTGDTGHLTATTLGAIPGDNLFGPGGWLEFHDLVDFGSFPGITLNLSSGADTIYAQPLASARVTINAGNPTAAPGDTLNLELATAENYVVNGTPTNGNVTSTNLMTLSYTGFETGPIIGTAPDLPGDYNRDGAVDTADYILWRAMLGTSVAQAFAGADGSGNYTIGPEDHGVWVANFGQTLLSPGAGSGAVALDDGTTNPTAGLEASRSAHDAVERRTDRLRPATHRGSMVESRASENRHDAALMAWFLPVSDHDSAVPDAGDDDADDKIHSRDSVFDSLSGNDSSVFWGFRPRGLGSGIFYRQAAQAAGA
ncbi:MAG: hypothetical protein L0Z50_40755, partial [Verrucomicrobiales bacterium]|nr:hypothetical protein [Verrucomicrobiales bacterium]